MSDGFIAKTRDKFKDINIGIFLLSIVFGISR
jgi:hypothetical protein